MTVTKFAKTVAYAVISLLMSGLAVWITGPMYTSAQSVTAYLRSDMLLFLAACGVLGVGVYSYIGYTKRHPEHRRDSWFWIAVGAALLVTVVGIVLRFGGISEENFDETANAAINLNLMLAGVLPLPFLVRTWVLAGGVRGKKMPRAVALSAAAVATVLYMVLIATGQLLHTVPYEAAV